MNPLKNGGIEFAFLHGHKLSNHLLLLKKKDRKLVAGVEIHNVKDVSWKEITHLLHEAILLEEWMTKN
ncbi:MAG: calcineurin-like phosphoesterase family protein [Cyclobacteriaceae bacterium]